LRAEFLQQFAHFPALKWLVFDNQETDFLHVHTALLYAAG
jgi:hypothetical protein